jgi:hypothetical protein
MKRKVKVKSLPKAQTGKQAPMILNSAMKNNFYSQQNPWGNFPGLTGNFNVGMPTFEVNTSPSFYADVYQGDPNTTGSFNVGNKINENASNIRGTSFANFLPSDVYYGENNLTPALPKGTPLEMPTGWKPTAHQSWDYQIPTKAPKSPKNDSNDFNPYIGPMLLAGTDVFSSVARKLQDRNRESDFRNQFLSDNLYNVRPEDYQGNRGDYLTNTAGLGPDFRPDDYIYGDYNKIAQMGGEMKRKVRITSLPQAEYGGTQNAKAVNQLYGNSAYMMNMFNGATKGEPEEQYGQTLGPDPRSMAVLEAEKGETLIRKGTNSTIPEFFKIGGKRHSEGGTPLSGEKATPDSFIYSDTKAMKIKDPAILESFGFAAKKGGYTPAKISKKFDLNNKDLREGLYSENDPLRKKTAVMVADNYISNLGKLALVQESQKGFPQGVPEIAMPYMNKIGLDPAQFLPPSPEEGMTMAMYGGMYKAQIGGSVLNNTSGSYPAKQSLNQFMTPSPYYRENNFGPVAGMAIGPDGKPIKLRSDVYDWDAKYNINTMPDKRPLKPGEIDWSLLDNPKFQGYNPAPSKSQTPSASPVTTTQKVTPTAQTPKAKVNVTKPSTGYTAPDGSIIEFEYGGIPLAQDGAQTGAFLGKHKDSSGNEYSAYLQGDKVVLINASNEVVGSRTATEKDKPAISTYDEEEKKLLKSIAPNLILPEDYVEGNQPGKVAKIPGTYGRFDKEGANKNWSWYNKPIDWTNQNSVGDAQLAYNKEMYNRFIKAGYTPEEAARYVKTIGFDENKTSGIPNAFDKKAGKYTETRVVFDVPPKQKKPGENPERDPLEAGQLNINSVTPRRPIGFYPQDVLNTAAAIGDLASINKYNPRMVQFNAEPIEPTYYDPNRELANNAEMVNMAAQQLAQFTGPQAFNSRFSDVQGKGLANAANILGRYNNLNVGVANQFEQANKQLINEANFRNQLAANDFYDKTVVANQQYDNARRQGRRQSVDYINAALDNRFITEQMNSLYPNFYVEPSRLKTYYTPGRQITPQQKGQDIKTYLESTGIPFDFADPAVQAALLKGIMGDVNVDERGNIAAAQAAMNAKRRGK